jgi:hypothetical protein
MSQWRIRVAVPAGRSGCPALAAALAGFQASELILAAPAPDAAELTADVVVELGDDDELGRLLRELHAISPQVFISRVRQPEQQATRSGRRPIRVRSLRAAAGVVR